MGLHLLIFLTDFNFCPHSVTNLLYCMELWTLLRLLFVNWFIHLVLRPSNHNLWFKHSLRVDEFHRWYMRNNTSIPNTCHKLFSFIVISFSIFFFFYFLTGFSAIIFISWLIFSSEPILHYWSDNCFVLSWMIFLLKCIKRCKVMFYNLKLNFQYFYFAIIQRVAKKKVASPIIFFNN